MPVEATGERNRTSKSDKKKVNDYGTGFLQHEMEALARLLLKRMQEFYVTEEGQRLFCPLAERAEETGPEARDGAMIIRVADRHRSQIDGRPEKGLL